jgi:hypothetical protein
MLAVVPVKGKRSSSQGLAGVECDRTDLDVRDQRKLDLASSGYRPFVPTRIEHRTYELHRLRIVCP